jgi:hypothetical protein
MSFRWCWSCDAESRAIIGVFAAVAAIKLFLLAALGPISQPDTSGYVEYAEQILRSTTWLHDADLSSSPTPITAVRVVGYPALIAAAMTIAGSHWPYLVIALQFALSFVAGWGLYRLASELTLPWQVSLAAVATFMLSLQLTLDQSLLTDSINSSCLVISICLLAGGAVAHRPLRIRQAALAGLLMALAFVFREALQFLVVTLVPLIAVRLWLAGRGRLASSVVACGLVLAPLLATTELYKMWNLHRTGERFVTTISTLNLVQAIAQAAKYDTAVVAGDTPFDRVVREQFKDHTYSEVISFNDALFNQGIRATDLSRMAYAHYYRAWREHPWAMLGVLRRHISEREAKLTIRPLAAICETIEWATNKLGCYHYRDLSRSLPFFQGLPWTAPAFFVLQTAEIALAVTLFGGFLIGVPCLIVMGWFSTQGRVDAAILTIASFWLLYVGWFTAYGIVHVEDRYLMPVLPFSILGGFYVYRELFSKGRAPVKAAVSIR